MLKQYKLSLVPGFGFSLPAKPRLDKPNSQNPGTSDKKASPANREDLELQSWGFLKIASRLILNTFGLSIFLGWLLLGLYAVERLF